MGLVLERRATEAIQIGDALVTFVHVTSTGRVKVSIEADRSVPIHRMQLVPGEGWVREVERKPVSR